jgi:predicted dehydrogenase
VKSWAVLGGGGIAPSHLTSLARAGVEVAGVADVDEGARTRVREAFGVPAYASIKSLLDEARPAAVTIALPAHLHLPAARLAAERGVHVLCEKPLAGSVAECDEMIAVCAEGGVQLGAILNNRGYAQTRWIRSAIEEGRWHPRVVGVRAAMGRFGPGAPAGVMVFGVGVHYLDQMRWWLGEPEAVAAHVADGVALAAIRFAGGAGELRLSAVGRTSAGVRVDIEGDEARLTLGRYGIESYEGELGQPPEWDAEVEGMAFGAGHLTVIREAVEALEAGLPFPVPGTEGRAAVALCEAIVRAGASGRWEAVA